MDNIEKLGFDSWFKGKVDLSKPNFSVVRVISVKITKSLRGLLW